MTDEPVTDTGTTPVTDSLDDIEIELNGSSGTDRPEVRPRPAVSKWLGAREKRLPVVAFFQGRTVVEMWRHATSVTDREVGGIIVGDIFEDGGSVYAVVEGIIPATQATERSASVTFTHETWNQILAVLDQKYPNKKVLGWYHTHPGYGIFLSARDIHIHEGFFTLPYQVAVVIEPIANKVGIFQWYNGKLELAGGLALIGSSEEMNLVIKTVRKPRKLRPPAKQQQTFDEFLQSEKGRQKKMPSEEVFEPVTEAEPLQDLNEAATGGEGISGSDGGDYSEGQDSVSSNPDDDKGWFVDRKA